MNVGNAVSQLTGMLNDLPCDVEGSKKKAEILGKFAVGVAEEILLHAGFKRDGDDPSWEYNLLVKYIEDFPEAPADCFAELVLNEVSSSLTEVTVPEKWISLACGIDRVIDFDVAKNRIRRVMSYEEAARFVIFWLAEKILQIIRKNEWDRVQQLPDLFDRLATFFTSLPIPTVLSSGMEMKIRLNLRYDPMIFIKGSSPRIPYSLTPALRRAGFEWPYLLDLVKLSQEQFTELVEKHSPKKTGEALKKKVLSVFMKTGLSFGMEIPKEVLDWCMAKRLEIEKEFERRRAAQKIL